MRHLLRGTRRSTGPRQPTDPRQATGAGRAAGAPRRRRRVLRLTAAACLGGLGLVAGLLAALLLIRPGAASAATTVNCSVSGTTLTISPTGATGSSNVLGIAADSSGNYAITLGGSPVSGCGSAVALYPNVTVSSTKLQDVKVDFANPSGSALVSDCVAFTLDIATSSTLAVVDGQPVAVSGSSVTIPETSCTSSAVLALADISTLNVQGSQTATSTLDLTGVPTYSAGSTLLQVHLGTDTAGSTAGSFQFGSGSSSLSVTFSGETTIDGSSAVGTAFFPENTVFPVNFVGSPGEPNVLDLSGSTVATGFLAAMNAATTPLPSCGVGELDVTTTSTTVKDCFQGINTFNGSPSVKTVFQPDPTLQSGAATPTFAGNNATAGDSVVDLGPFASSTNDTISGLSVAAGTDTSGSGATPGTVTASVTTTGGTNPVTFASFSGVNQVLGSTYLPTAFQPGDATQAIELDGQGSGPNVLDLSGETGSKAGAFTVAVNGDVASPSSGLGAVTGVSKAGNAIADTFSGIQRVSGAPSGTDFQPGSATGVAFTGGGPAAGNTLDLSHETALTSLTVAMNAQYIVVGGAPPSCGLGVGEVVGSTTAPVLDDCFTGVGVVKASTAVPTAFQPDPALTASVATVFVGNGTSSAASTIDLRELGSSSVSTSPPGSLTASIAANSSGSPGVVTAQVTQGVSTSNVTFASFYGISQVLGSTNEASIFQPGTAGGVTFTGTSGLSNVIDLSGSSPSAFSALKIAMRSAVSSACATSGEIDGTTSGPAFQDCFSNVTVFDGAPSVPTSFAPDPTATSSSPVPSFVGNDTSAGGSVVDLSALSSGVPEVLVGSDTSGAPGSVSTLGVTYVTFSGVNQVNGSTSQRTFFFPGDASGLTFVGKSGNDFVDLASESGGAATAFTVTSAGDSSASPGRITGTSPKGVGVNDSFVSIGLVDGAPNGTDFQPGSTGLPTFYGACSATNTLDLSNFSAASPIQVSSNGVSGDCSGEGDWISNTSGGATTYAYGVQQVKGSTSTETNFSPGASSGTSFIGQGTNLQNTIDLSNQPAGDTVTMNQDNAGSPGQWGPTTGSPQGSFQQVQVVVGSPEGTTFVPGATGGVTFDGAPSPTGGTNILQLPSSAAPLTVDVAADGIGTGTPAPGDVSGLGAGFGGLQTDSFSWILSFAGNPGTGGSTFNANAVGQNLTYSGAGQGTNTLSFGSLVGAGALRIDAVASQATFTGATGTIATFSHVDHFVGCEPALGGCTGTTFSAGIGSTDNYLGLGPGTSNVLDYSGVASGQGGVSVNESAGTGTATPSSGGSVGFSDVLAFVGSPNNDTFTAGAGSASFTGDGGSDTISFAADPAGITFQLSATGCTGSVTVQCEQATIKTTQGTDTATGMTTFDGSSLGSNTFQSDGYGGHSFQAGSGPGNLLDLSGQSLTGTEIDAAGGCSPLPNCVSGLLAGLGSSTTDFFSGVQTFNGSTGGTTFLSAGANGYAFNGENGIADVLNLTSAPTGVRVNDSGGSGSVTTGTASENFSNISSVVGPSGGGATFVASPTTVAGAGTCFDSPAPPVTFVGQGPSNTLDLSAVVTTATQRAVVDAQPACPSGSVQQGTVTAGSELESFADISTFVGPKSGDTTFVTGNNGGLTFEGASQSSGNTMSFADVTGGGGVQVFLTPNGANLDAASPGTGTDLFSGMSTVVGSSGADTFNGGPGTFTLYGNGGNDTFNGSSAPIGLTISQAGGTATVTGGYSGQTTTNGITSFIGSTSGGNTFVTDGTGGFSFSVPSGSSSGANTLSFANVTSGGSGVAVNVTSSTGNGTVAGLTPPLGGSATTDSFTNIETYVGSPNPDTFRAGLGSFQFQSGGGAGGDSLSFANTTVPVTIDLTQSTPTVTGSGISDTASGFVSFTGSSQGGSDFIALGVGGYSFTGLGSPNTLDLSAAPSGIAIDAQSGQVSGLSAGVGGATTDNFGGIQHFAGPAQPVGGSPTDFTPSCAGGQQFNGVSGSTLTLDFSGCSSSPAALVVDAVKGFVSPLPLGGSDTFSGITTFVGPSSGHTTFIAPGTLGSGGLTFNANGGPGDTLDASAFPAAATIDNSQSPGVATIDSGESDSFAGITCFVGSSQGSMMFMAGSGQAADASACTESGVPHLTFYGKGTGNSLDLAAITTSIVASPATGIGSVADGTGPGAHTYDTFAGMQSFVGPDPATATGTLNLSSYGKGMVVDTLAGTAGISGQPSATVSFTDFEDFTGSAAGFTTFRPDAGGSYQFVGQASGNALDLSAAPAPLSLDLTVSCGGYQAVALTYGDNPCAPPVGTYADTFTGIQSFTGSSGGGTTFRPDATGSYTFTGQGSGNGLDLSSGPAGIIINLAATCNGTGAVALASGANPCSPPAGTPTDHFTGVQTVTGPTAGSAVFTAPGPGSGGYAMIGQGQGNSLAFAPLSGSSLTVDDIAGVATSPAWSSSDAFSDMSSFTGPSSGKTAFVLPGGTGGIGVTGQGAGNTLDASAFPSASRINEDPSSGPDLATPGSLSPDPFSGMTCVVGSSAGGTTFVAPAAISPSPSTCSEQGQPAVNFVGQQTGNSLDLSGLPVATTISPAAGTVVGTTATTITYDTFFGLQSFTGSSTELTTLDLSAMPAGTTIDVANGLATPPPVTVAPVSFSSIGSFVGSSSGSTTFLASGTAGGYSFTGQGGNGNVLSFAGVPAGGPGVSVNLETGSATSSAWSAGDSLAGMQRVIGSVNPDVFFGGPTAVTLVGDGGSDTLSYAGAPAPANVTLAATPTGTGTATGGYGGTVSLQGIQNVVSSPAGGTITGNSSPSVFTGGNGADVFVLTGGDDTVNGGGGHNTLDLSNEPGFVSLNLFLSGPQSTGGGGVLTVAPGTIQNVIGSDQGNHLVAGLGDVTITGGQGNDWLQAGTGTDTLNAGQGTDVLVGGPGYTTFNGGPGTDTYLPGSGNGKINDPDATGTLDYAYSPVRVQVNLGSSRYTAPSGVSLAPATAVAVGRGTLKLNGIENVTGSNHGDILVGSSGANTITGGSGTNLIVGNGGDDTLQGGTGNDTFITGNGDALVYGGGGHNTIDYVQATSAVTANLVRGVANPNGYGGTDRLSGIQNIIGSRFADSLTLGANPGTIRAGNGTGVTLTGSKKGHDTMHGGTGGDTFVSIGPADTMRGGAGPNQFYANNGFVDNIYGGGVYDTAVVDCLDVSHKTIHNVTRIVLPPGGCPGSALRFLPPSGVPTSQAGAGGGTTTPSGQSAQSAVGRVAPAGQPGQSGQSGLVSGRPATRTRRPARRGGPSGPTTTTTTAARTTTTTAPTTTTTVPTSTPDRSPP